MEEFKEKIINSVRNLTIKPKSHFVIKTIFSVLSILVFLFLSLFLISLISFILRINAFNHLPRFGWFGISVFFSNLPWGLILLSLGFIIGLYYLSKRYSLVYKKPVIYSLIIIVIVVLVSGFAIGKTGFHTSLSDKKIPLMKNLYGMKIRQMNRGEILDIQGKTVTFRNSKGEKCQAIISSSTKAFQFKKGDEILVVGKRRNHSINARGIMAIPRKMK